MPELAVHSSHGASGLAEAKPSPGALKRRTYTQKDIRTCARDPRTRMRVRTTHTHAVQAAHDILTGHPSTRIGAQVDAHQLRREKERPCLACTHPTRPLHQQHLCTSTSHDGCYTTQRICPRVCMGHGAAAYQQQAATTAKCCACCSQVDTLNRRQHSRAHTRTHTPPLLMYGQFITVPGCRLQHP